MTNKPPPSLLTEQSQSRKGGEQTYNLQMVLNQPFLNITKIDGFRIKAGTGKNAVDGRTPSLVLILQLFEVSNVICASSKKK